MTDLYHPLREREDALCWRLLNGDTRACVLGRGHDDGAHEEDPERACASTLDHPGHDWTQRYVCNGRGPEAGPPLDES